MEQELELTTIQGHPQHGTFDVQTPVGWDETKTREYVNGLDLDLMLGVQQPKEAGETEVQVIKDFENNSSSGLREGKWYGHDSLEGGTQTLAYGHKLTPSESKSGFIDIDGTLVDHTQGLSQEQAEAVLKTDTSHAQAVAVASLKKNGMEGDEGKVQALTSLIYNVGSGAWGGSKAKKYLESGAIEDFMHEAFSEEVGFVKMNGDKMRGLVRRRAAEAQLFASSNIAEGSSGGGGAPMMGSVGGSIVDMIGILKDIVPDFVSPAEASTPQTQALEEATKAMNSLSGGAPTLRQGSKDKESVGTLQDMLGMFTGKDKGIFGTKTLTAVKQFQTDNGLKPDGVVGKGTWGKLQSKGADKGDGFLASLFGGNEAQASIPLKAVEIPKMEGLPKEFEGRTFNLLETDHAELAINQMALSLFERSGLPIPSSLTRDITEEDFTQSVLSSIKEVSLEKIKRGKSSTQYNQFGKEVTDVIHKKARQAAAVDHPLGEVGVVGEAALKSFVDPQIAAAFAFGRATNVYIDDRGHVIYEDVYDYEDDGDNIVGQLFGPKGMFPVSKGNARKVKLDLGPANSLIGGSSETSLTGGGEGEDTLSPETEGDFMSLDTGGDFDKEFGTTMVTELTKLVSPGQDIADAVAGSSKTMEALKQGDAMGAAVGVAEMVAGLAGVVVPGSQKIKSLGKTLVSKGKTREDIRIQGGPLSTKPNQSGIERILDDHGWQSVDPMTLPPSERYGQYYYDSPRTGKVVAEEWSKGKKLETKTFDDSSSLKTIREWLGY